MREINIQVLRIPEFVIGIHKVIVIVNVLLPPISDHGVLKK